MGQTGIQKRPGTIPAKKDKYEDGIELSKWNHTVKKWKTNTENHRWERKSKKWHHHRQTLQMKDFEVVFQRPAIVLLPTQTETQNTVTYKNSVKYN